MKKCAFLLITLLFATALSAASKNTATITLRDAVTVGTSTLPAGEYKVTWTEPGADSKVTFAHGKTTVAVIPATIVAQQNASVSVLTATQGSTLVLNGLRLKTAEVTFGNTSKSGH
jgi:hypothetical protein